MICIILLVFPCISFSDSNNISTKKIRLSGYWDLTGSPILVDDDDPSYNWAITAATNDWCYGVGSWNDPYIIENVTIDGQNSGSCITVKESTVFFIIRNCTLYNSGNNLNTLDSGIHIKNTRNGIIRITRVQIIMGME